MSELKAHTIYTPMDDVAHDEKGKILEGKEVYLKSEADKVIAEKDAEIERVKRLNEKLHNELMCLGGNTIIECYKSERHSDYKRCLAMAEICCEKKENCYNRALRKYSKDEADYLVRKSEFWQDWEFRWLKLAEKFKEAK